MKDYNFIKWFAGFFDGEGHICLRYLKRTNGYHLHIGISNTYRPIIDLIEIKLGGNRVTLKRKNYYKIKSRKTAHRLRWNGIEAIKVLKLIKPYLMVKKEQVDIALKFNFSEKFAKLSKAENLNRKRLYTKLQKLYKKEWK